MAGTCALVIHKGTGSPSGNRCAATAAFLDPEQYRNTVIPVYDEVLTFRQMVETFSATGIKATCELWLALCRLHVSIIAPASLQLWLPDLSCVATPVCSAV